MFINRRTFLLSVLAVPIVMQLPLQKPDWEVLKYFTVKGSNYVVKRSLRDLPSDRGITIPKGSIYYFYETENSN